MRAFVMVWLTVLGACGDGGSDADVGATDTEESSLDTEETTTMDTASSLPTSPSDTGSSTSTDTGYSTPTDTGFYGTVDTAYAFQAWVGEAIVDVEGGTFSGSESYWIATFPPNGTKQHSSTLCEWTWQLTDWEHSTQAGSPNPIQAPCTSPSGQPCDFAFTLLAENGSETAGACANWQVFSSYGVHFGYGFLQVYETYGYTFYDALSYYDPSTASWKMGTYHQRPGQFTRSRVPETYRNVVRYDDQTGDFEWSWVP